MAVSILPYPFDSSTTTVTINLSGQTKTNNLYKKGNVCFLQFAIGNGTLFSSATGLDEIGVLPLGYRPAISGDFNTIFFDNGNWGDANYHNILLTISTNGTMSLKANASVLQQCKYGRGAIIFIV